MSTKKTKSTESDKNPRPEVTDPELAAYLTSKTNQREVNMNGLRILKALEGIEGLQEVVGNKDLTQFIVEAVKTKINLLNRGKDNTEAHPGRIKAHENLERAINFIGHYNQDKPVNECIYISKGVLQSLVGSKVSIIQAWLDSEFEEGKTQQSRIDAINFGYKPNSKQMKIDEMRLSDWLESKKPELVSGKLDELIGYQ